MLEVKNLSFSYYPGQEIIHSISFNLEPGKMLAIIGESGSGKSTILKLIYGILPWEKGEIYYNQQKLLGPKGNLVPGESEFKLLEQDFGLMPYSTVSENVGFFLSNIKPLEKRKRINRLLDLVEMSDYANTKTIALSGGQKQRISLAKALAQTPSILLLDEPFSQIDTFRKNYLKRAVFEFAKENGISIILATHDVEDALAFSDTMMVVKKGEILQEGTPGAIYMNPKNEYVANLFGETNILHKKDFSEFWVDDTVNKIAVYSHQLTLAEKGIPIKILKNYFTGSHYLIVAIYNNIRIYFTHSYALLSKEKYFLKISDYQKLQEN